MIEPMLAHDASGRDASDCYWERKFNGVRVLAFVHGGNVRLQARSGTDKTSTFPELRIETRKNAILDGEVVSESGAFSSIQRRVNRVYDIEMASKFLPVKYEVFDILASDYKVYEEEPLENRKQLLEEILVPTHNVVATQFTLLGYKLWQKAQEEGWEGIIGKKKDSPYEEGKRRWLKLKLAQKDEFFVVGYTPGINKRESTFGSLVLTNKDGVHVGQVGTGFDTILIEELMRDMVKGESPFKADPVEAQWVKPFKVSIRFLEYTNDGMLRSAAFRKVL